VASACGLWCVLVGGTHPYFLFLLEGWWNTTSPLFSY
jgi:tRNA A37 N6-isopentenylltransferase MiaA